MLKIITKDNVEAEVRRLIKRKTISTDLPQEKVVAEIIAAVKKDGDKALSALTKKHDGIDWPRMSLRSRKRRPRRLTKR